MMIFHQVNFYFILLEERFATQLTLERLEASVNLGMSKKIESFGEAFTANIAIKRRSIGRLRSIIIRENFRFDEMRFDVSLEHIRVLKRHVTLIAQMSIIIILIIVVELLVVLIRIILGVAVIIVIDRF